jgi:hypothetical protein
MPRPSFIAQAFALLDAALALAPEYARVHYGKAFALRYANRSGGGLAEIEKAHLLAPEDQLIASVNLPSGDSSRRAWIAGLSSSVVKRSAASLRRSRRMSPLSRMNLDGLIPGGR